MKTEEDKIVSIKDAKHMIYAYTFPKGILCSYQATEEA